MKVQLIRFLVLAFIFFGATSCKKPLQERLIGDWNYELNDQYEESDFTRNIIYDGEITFYENGEGSEIAADGLSYDFVWDQKDDELTFWYLSLNLSITYGIVENKRKKQVWEFPFTFQDEYASQRTGMRTWTLTR